MSTQEILDALKNLQTAHKAEKVSLSRSDATKLEVHIELLSEPAPHPKWVSNAQTFLEMRAADHR